MERENENPFAAVIRILRGETPQGVFAERLGIKQAKYSHYENHRREPSLDELCRIARALNTTPNVLLGFDPPPLCGSAALRETKTNIRAAANSAVAVGTNARATVSAGPPGDAPLCSRCPYKKKWLKIEAMK